MNRTLSVHRMNDLSFMTLARVFLAAILIPALAACLPVEIDQPTPTALAMTATIGLTPTPLPTRPEYEPGVLVDYTARSGDTLPALAARFNTTAAEIRAANPDIPADATTMPPGMPMQIPIYYRPFWGTSYQILPDSLFVNGLAAVGFDTSAFVNNHTGWLKDFTAYAAGDNHSGAEIVDIVATNYSLSPRILLAVLDYQIGALSSPIPPVGPYPLGERDYTRAGFYLQLIWAANALNNGFYGWRTGQLTQFDHPDGSLESPDPWQTAASVAFQYYYSRHFPLADYDRAVGPEGLARAYRQLFGDPWPADQANIPVSLQQPLLSLPFPAGETWTLTGGPHTGWGTTLYPWAAVDFAPPAETGGCVQSNHLVVAMADGVVVRSEPGVVMLDLDGDGDERTGWVLLYLHIATAGRVSVGRTLKRGDPIGYPSCEGGTATGTHVHVARKYNGEWIAADSAIPFNLDGWVAHNGSQPYAGSLTRGGLTVIACSCSDATSRVTAGP
jgi:LasA protease